MRVRPAAIWLAPNSGRGVRACLSGSAGDGRRQKGLPKMLTALWRNRPSGVNCPRTRIRLKKLLDLEGDASGDGPRPHSHTVAHLLRTVPGRVVARSVGLGTPSLEARRPLCPAVGPERDERGTSSISIAFGQAADQPRVHQRRHRRAAVLFHRDARTARPRSSSDDRDAAAANTLARSPGLTIEGFMGTPDWTDADRKRFVEPMRAAGFPVCAPTETLAKDPQLVRLPERLSK